MTMSTVGVEAFVLMAGLSPRPPLDSVTGGRGKPFHVIVGMMSRGDQSAIACVRKALEQKEMQFVSSASTTEKDIESGAFLRTLETFAAGIRR
jgi:hypothetical protein